MEEFSINPDFDWRSKVGKLKCIHSPWRRRKISNEQLQSYSFFQCIVHGVKKHWPNSQISIKNMLKDTKETYYGCGPSTPFLIKPWDVEHQQYIAHWEQQYDCNINIYIYLSDTAAAIKPYFYSDVIETKRRSKQVDLLWLEGFYFYIRNVPALTKVYSCICTTFIEKELNGKTLLKRHMRNCEAYQRYAEAIANGGDGADIPRMKVQKHVYKQGPYVPVQYPTDCVEKLLGPLNSETIQALQKNFLVVFDSESYLRPLMEEETLTGSENLTFTHKHEMMLITVASNVPGFEEAYFMEEEEGQPHFVLRFVQWLLECADAARVNFLRNPHIADLFRCIEQTQNNYKHNNKPGLVVQYNKLVNTLMTFAQQLTVLSYNGGNYDMVTFRELGGLYYLAKNDGGNVRIIKKGTTYMLVQSPRLRFVDVLQFLGCKCSLREYLRSYQISVKEKDEEKLAKQYFCYNYLKPETLYNPLVQIQYEHFYDSLSNQNVLDEDYQHYIHLTERNGKSKDDALQIMKLKEVPPTGRQRFDQLQERWRREGLRNLKDLVISYGMSDVQPLLKAALHQQQSYFNLGIFPFTHHASISSLAFHFAIRTSRKSEAEWGTFYTPEEEVYKMIRSGIKGGLSLVMRRYAEVGISTIRPYLSPTGKGKPVKLIDSRDCNGMYTYALSQEMFVGAPILRRKENGFAPEIGGKAHSSIIWMSYETERLRRSLAELQHKFSSGYEKNIYIKTPTNIVRREERRNSAEIMECLLLECIEECFI